MKPTIMKFGGTSVQDADAFRSVAGHRAARRRAPDRWSSVSAIGGFTNALLASVEKAIRGDARAATRSLSADLERHVTIAGENYKRSSPRARSKRRLPALAVRFANYTESSPLIP